MKRLSQGCFLLVVSGIIVAGGCGNSSDKVTPKPDKEGGKTTSLDKKQEAPAPAVKAPEKKTVAPPNPRHPLLEAEWTAYEDRVIVNDASGLPDGDKMMLVHLLEASKLVEELHMLQLHPENLKWRDMVVAAGADIEKKVFFRNQMPWCEDNPNEKCRVLDEVPPKKEIGFMHWPSGFGEADVKALSSEINGRELLSPFTVVRRNPAGGYTAIPFSRHELLGPKLNRLSEVLKKAASYAPDKTLKTFLEARAEAVVSHKPFPYDPSDLDWIAVKGEWEVTVGPYEVYNNPFQTKALFEMFIGKEDHTLTATLADLKKRAQEMENALAALVGEAVYKPRKLDTNMAIRAINVWMASGDGRNSRGATVAFHLPNRGEAIDKGLYKKVLLVNHSRAFESVAKARAELVLDPPQAALVNFQDNVINVAFHEMSHGFGAHSEMVIVDKEGRRTTVKEALRKYDSLFEELKADVLGLWLSQYLFEHDNLSEEALAKRFVSNLVHVLGLLQYPLDGTYPKMAAMQLGWFLENGGVVWHPESKQLQVVPAKMSTSLTELTKQVSVIQLTGDYSAADALFGKYIDEKDDEVTLKGPLSEIREAIVSKFKASGIKSPSLRYEVKGLPR